MLEKTAVDGMMIIVEGRITVSNAAGTQTARQGEIIYMPKGADLTIRSHEESAVTAYGTYPIGQKRRPILHLKHDAVLLRCR